MNPFIGMNALLIEPNTSMRGTIHSMFGNCGLTKIDHAVSSGTAIRQIKNKIYDIIVCEYDLAEGQDGQQLLEDLRHNKLIPLQTLFLMVTAERGHQKVVSAAELAPTDYLLKPFTTDALLERLTRAVERREIFFPVYRLMEQGALQDAIALCQSIAVTHPRFHADFLRLRAELHVILGQPADAEPIYRELFDIKAVAWARLGLAKTLFMQNRVAEAEQLLTQLVLENNHFLDAYDWLAKAHEASNQLPRAKDVLQAAVAISPHAVRRLRKLGAVALQTGDVDTATHSFQQVISKARYSEFRDPEDHVRLVQTLVSKGDAEQAASVIRDLEKSLDGLKKTAACKALSNALLQSHAGDHVSAASHLSAAVAACRDPIDMSNEMKMTLATHCFEHDMEEGASEVMLDVMNNAPDDSTLAKAMAVFQQAGRTELAHRIASESQRQVVDMVSSGAEKARAGDFRGAVDLMSAAALKLPNNPQVVFNAAVAALKCLEHTGWDQRLGGHARWYIDNARRLDAANPRLSALSELYQTIMKKYGVGAAQAPAPRAPQMAS